MDSRSEHSYNQDNFGGRIGIECDAAVLNAESTGAAG